MSDDESRASAREMAARSLASGDDTGWFEALYSAAAEGRAIVPWADLAANPDLVERVRPGSGSAVVVGCGLGDDAEYLASLGWKVTAFDVSPSAVEQARARFGGSSVDYVVADLLAPPAGWAFDLVVEIYTVQVLTAGARRAAIANTAALVAPGGTLLVIARARADDESEGLMPWPLTRGEMESFADGGLRPVTIADFLDGEDPPVRRWHGEFRRD
ncbi:class I SAM-dependent methyltransferase [Phytomonospora sp. NPDC050363]|uniref:class I SAM-dependent methyltransferase n=1 Tax=Phytomonospora sp. NPDC050363 TaxID=3155642 RepID=UPI0033F7E165